MSIVAKAYNSTHIDGLVINASDIRRALDDIYDEYNGNLNSSNFATSITLFASQVTIVDSQSYVSATSLENLMYEIKQKGENTIHVMAQRSNGITLFPGRVEVNGVVGLVNSRLDITAVTLISGVFQNTQYAVTVPAVNVITASDVQLVTYADISASASPYGLGLNAQNGYYFSSTRRSIYTVTNRITASQDLFDYGYLDPPWVNHSYKLSAQEASQIGFYYLDLSAMATGNLYNVSRHFDRRINSYRYYVDGKFPSLSATMKINEDYGPKINIIPAPTEYLELKKVWAITTGNVVVDLIEMTPNSTTSTVGRAYQQVNGAHANAGDAVIQMWTSSLYAVNFCAMFELRGLNLL